QAMLDYMRRKKAVVYGPFSDYLSAGSDFVQKRIARPNRFNREPRGFASQAKHMNGAYRVYSWEDPRSGTFDLVRRTLDGWKAEKITAFIKGVTSLLVQKGYVRKVKIGQLTGGKANLTWEGYQLVPKYLEVTTDGKFYQC